MRLHDYREEIDGPQGRIEAGNRRILGKGGGKSSDGGAAKREAERQARITAGTNAVNNIFGIGNDDAAQQRQAMYDTTKEDVRSYYTKQLEEDKANARRQLNFQKARQGTFGSSQANDIDTEFQKAYDTGLLDVANRADTAATNFKTSDEQSRLNLISKVVAGLDQGTAAQNAAATLQTNANAAKEAYASSRMANVFSDLLESYNQGQYIAGTQAAKQQQANPYGNFYPSSGDDGTITKAG